MPDVNQNVTAVTNQTVQTVQTVQIPRYNANSNNGDANRQLLLNCLGSKQNFVGVKTQFSVTKGTPQINKASFIVNYPELAGQFEVFNALFSKRCNNAIDRKIADSGNQMSKEDAQKAVMAEQTVEEGNSQMLYFNAVEVTTPFQFEGSTNSPFGVGEFFPMFDKELGQVYLEQQERAEKLAKAKIADLETKVQIANLEILADKKSTAEEKKIAVSIVSSIRSVVKSEAIL